MGSQPAEVDGAAPSKVVMFFDIDNCLYSRNVGVYSDMRRLIDEYFETHISPSREEAEHLHKKYYEEYGLALEGLVKHHKIDPLEYNSKVDDAVDLDHLLTKDEDALQQIRDVQALFKDVDRERVTVWLFTNAYLTHGARVARIMGLDGQYDGLTYCDYAAQKFVCKPHKEAYARAMEQAGNPRPQDCYFVDDSGQNCRAAMEIGWTAAHLVEEGVSPPKKLAAQFQIRAIKDLPTVFPELFKSTQSKSEN